MLSNEEKTKIAKGVEAILKELNNKKFPKDHIDFSLHVKGIESWDWSNIVPNWKQLQYQKSLAKKVKDSEDKKKRVIVKHDAYRGAWFVYTEEGKPIGGMFRREVYAIEAAIGRGYEVLPYQ